MKEKYRIQRKNRRDRFRESGLCLDCGKRSEEGFLLCTEHLNSHREASKRIREKKKASNLCLQCEEKVAPGLSRCLFHAHQHRLDYHNRVGEGVCPRCGGVPDKDNKLCISCKGVQKDRRKKIVEAGECPNHRGIPAKEGTTYCHRCAWQVSESSLRITYKISIEDYAWMEYIQERKCASCGDIPHKGLVVDHSHSTGEVRGLLCGPCNRLLGHALEQPFRLEAASAYLKRFSGG